MNATTSALRLAPLALCLALTACGGSSGSDRGNLGTLDPISLPLDENFAPVAARLAVTYPAVVADAYRGLFALLDTIETECDDKYITKTDLGNDTFELVIDKCSVASSTPAPSTHNRTSDLLLTYTEQSASPHHVDITRLEDDVIDAAGLFQTVQMTRADGTFTVTLNDPDSFTLTDSNSRFTRSVIVTDSNGARVDAQSNLLHLRLQDYDLAVDTVAGNTSSEHNGRLTTYVGSIEAYVDIETDQPLIQGENDDCPTSGEVTVTGRDDEIMSISFSGIDVSVMIGTTSLDYPLNCTEFLDWIAPDAI